MFLSDAQERKFLDVLTAYETEFGPEKVIVYVPISWKQIDLALFHPMEVRLWASNSIKIEVKNCSANWQQDLVGEINGE